MSEFTYKEIDTEGRETLEAIMAADKFNKWMYSVVAPHCSGNILEIGSGIGNISKYFVANKAEITLSDIRDNYLNELKLKFPEANGHVNMDIACDDFETRYSKYIGTFDSIFALNVVEHIKDHDLALINCQKLLKPEGKMIVLVPAYQSLYNRFDKELEHFRRYNKTTLNNLFERTKYEVIHSQYFNFMGIFGWYISGKLQNNKTIPKDQMALYNKLVPIFKLIDLALFKSIGLSVISVGIKKK